MKAMLECGDSYMLIMLYLRCLNYSILMYVGHILFQNRSMVIVGSTATDI